MNRKDQHIKNLLRQWISGDLNRKTEGELERLSKEDAFVKEAFDGLRKHPTHNHTASIDRLRKQINPAQKNTRKLSPIWRMAAAVLLLGIAGFTMWYAQQLQPATAMAHERTPNPVEETNQKQESVGDLVTNLEEPQRSQESAPVTTQKREEKRTFDTFEEKEAVADLGSTNDASLSSGAERNDLEKDHISEQMELAENGGDAKLATIEEDEAPGKVALSEPDVSLPATTVPAAPPPPPAAAYATERARGNVMIQNSGVPAAVSGDKLLQGIVLDGEGYPLIGANILEVGKMNGTVTDFDGRFLLAVDTAQNLIEVIYLGFETQQVNIRTIEEVEIVMEESLTMLSEVAVSSYTRDQDNVANTDNEVSSARPIDDNRAFNNYVQEKTNLVTARGRIRLRFDVLADGSVANIEIVRSTNAALNAYAIEIIEEGPRWEIKSGIAPVSVNYTIRFR